MYKNTKIHRIDHEKLIERYKELGSAKKTALEFDLSGPTVLKIIRSHGVEVNREFRKKYSDECVISKYYELGTVEKTCIELGLGDQRVRDILDRNNIERKRIKHISIGDVYGKLTVVEFVGYRNTGSGGKNKCKLFLCKCECGGTREVDSRRLTKSQKSTKDCGCGWKLIREGAELKRKEKQLRLEKRRLLRIERELKNKLKPKKSKTKYKVGYKQNRLTIISEVGKGRDKVFTVECECGTIKDIRRSSMYMDLKSCGCLQKERSQTHGIISKDRKGYHRWKSMLRRCHNPKSKAYHNYGGRGIYVCDRWRLPNGEGCKNYLKDIKEHLGPKPKGNYSLDRINNDGPYEISNLRWADASIQTKNQRRHKKNKGQTKIDFSGVKTFIG